MAGILLLPRKYIKWLGMAIDKVWVYAYIKVPLAIYVMDSMSTFHFEDVTKGNPVYVVKSHLGPERGREGGGHGPCVLLSDKLDTSMIALGGYTKKGIRVHVRTDHLGGSTLGGMGCPPRDPYDIFGHVSGRSRETVNTFGGDITVRLEKTDEGALIMAILDIAHDRTMVVLQRAALYPGFQELRGTLEDPYRVSRGQGRLGTISADFDQLVQVLEETQQGFHLIG